MTCEVKVSDIKDVWLVVTNSDLTEGRGFPVILHVCDNPVTAERLAKKQGVMGSNANVEKSSAYKIKSSWFMEGEIQRATKQDEEVYKIRINREAIIQKMREQGFTEEEISALK